MTIDIAITVHNEGKEISSLLDTLFLEQIFNNGESKPNIIVLDDNSTDELTLETLEKYSKESFISWNKKKFEGNFSDHKNYLNSLCSAEWIFQLDADELPPSNFLNTFSQILEENKNVEAYWIPRANFVRGLTEEHIKKWGWFVSKNPDFEVIRNKSEISSEEMKFLKSNNFMSNLCDPEDDKISHYVPLVCWPDYQMRLYRNIPNRIKWSGRVHEQISGYRLYGTLPNEYEYVIKHYKNLEKQKAQNSLYEVLMKEKNL